MAKTNQSISISMIWNMLERVGTLGAQFLVSIVLARILMPEAYGTLSLVTVFVNLATVVVETGFGSSIIQKKDIQKQEINIIFTFNLSVSILLYSILFLCAPLIASFYDKYDFTLLTRVIRTYALVLPIGAVTSIQSAMIYRNMDFKAFFLVNILAILGSSTVGITSALMGAGVWALVFQQLSSKTFLLLTQLFAVTWKPRLDFRFRKTIAMFRFGSNILLNRLLNMLYNQTSSLVIGKHYTSDMLAFYSKGNMLPAIIATNTDNALQKVMFSAYSKVQDDMTKVQAMMRKTISISTFLLCPLMFGMLSCSENFVRVVLTDKWLPCVPYMQIFCISFLLQPFSNTATQALDGIGRSDLSLRIGIFTKLAGIAIIVCAVYWGVLYVAFGVLLTSCLSAVVCMITNKKFFGYSFRLQLSDIAGSLLNAISMGAVCFGVAYLCRSIAPIAALALQIISGIIWYTAMAALFKNSNFIYLLNRYTPFKSKK